MATEDLVIRVRADGVLVVRRQIEGLGTAARGAAGGISTLNAALAGLGIGVLLREFAQLADGMTNINNRLKNVTSSAMELKAVQEELFALSNRSRSSFEGNAELFNRLALATREAGLSQAELLRITETMNQAVAVSGLRVQEATNGLIQLSQGLAAGRLNGDELRAVLEQLPPVADIIAKQLGVTRGELRKLGSEGKVTTQVIVDAFQAAEADVAAAFARMTPTIGQAFVVLRNEVLALIQSINDVTNTVPLLAQGVLWIADNLETLARIIGVVAFAVGPALLTTALIGATAALWAFTFAIISNPILLLITLIGAAVGYIVLFGDQVKIAADSMVNLQDLGIAVWESIVAGIQMVMAWIEPFFNMFGVSFENLNLDVQTVVEYFIKGFDLIFQVAASTVFALIAVWNNFPAAFMEILIDVTNGAIGVFEFMLNEIIRFFVLLPERLLNILTAGINLMIDAFIVFVDWLKGLPDAIADIFWNAMEMARQAVFDGIDAIGNLFEMIPGIDIPDLGAKSAEALIEVAVTNAETIDNTLRGIAESYKTLSEGGNVVTLDRVQQDYEGAGEKLGASIEEGIRKGMAMTPGSDWFKDILKRAEAIADERVRKQKDDDLIAPTKVDLSKTFPGGATGNTPPEAFDQKAFDKALRLKKELSTLEAALDNQVLADEGRVRALETNMADQLDTIRQALEARILTEQEAADRILAIHETTERKIRDVEYARYSMQLTAASETFDSLADITKTFAGEQSGIYKAMFIAAKAFAIADSLIKIQQGIANAVSIPWPANLGAIASVAAAAANIVSNIQAVSLALADGGPVSGPGTSRSDSIPAMLSNGEFVVNAASARNNMALLHAINSGSGAAVPTNLSPTFTRGSSGGGSTVQIIDQRSSGQQVQVERSVDSNGEEVIRAIIRDEVARTYAATSKDRYRETIGAVKQGQKRGAL